MKKIFFLGLFTIFLNIISCSKTDKKEHISDNNTSQIRYAKGFQISNIGEIQKITIKAPYQNS